MPTRVSAAAAASAASRQSDRLPPGPPPLSSSSSYCSSSGVRFYLPSKFTDLRPLGKGSFGTVMYVDWREERDTHVRTRGRVDSGHTRCRG